ncbi:IclR family transcriptional regulator [Rhodococcus qingshengii]|uniref:IclR family transcriptional regulator n=1 Tax=Rhodococcus qingshengii TaxID=334542 RepID=UPI0022B2F297|nr:IclR family transcriptional regulator [Rhodococcus qingshengii]MCZ4618622.1 IclR family transcriptional regulator [Rhodococcus qingshengii]
MQKDPEAPPYLIESVSTALRLLSMFRSREMVRVSDASRELGVAGSTAHRMLATMAHEGFVQQERHSRAYRPGPALLDFAISTSGVPVLRRVANPVMVDLSARFHETVNLLIREGASVRFIESAECERPVRVSGMLGALLPAHATAGGKVLLAALNPEDVRSLYGGKLPKVTGATTTSIKRLLEELDDIRDRGYALNLDESLDGLHAVAVSIRDSGGSVVASLAVSVPSDRGGASQLRRHVRLLTEAAQRIGALI